MDRAEFWRLVESARERSGGACGAQAAALTALLAERQPEEIVAFDGILRRVLWEAYDRRLWGAAYIIHGGCSDDAFEYFRGWLIAHGEQVFTTALRDPETLVPLLDPQEAGSGGHECEELLYVGADAYERRTGEELPAPDWLEVDIAAAQLQVEDWTEDDLLHLFPKLTAACGWEE